MATIATAHPDDRITVQAGGITGHSGYFNVR